MRTTPPWALLAPAAVCALLTLWIVLDAANVQAATLSVLLYGLANLIVYTDALDLLLRMHVRRRHTAHHRHVGPLASADQFRSAARGRTQRHDLLRRMALARRHVGDESLIRARPTSLRQSHRAPPEK